MKSKQCGFSKALNYVARFLGLEEKELSSEIRYPFSGFYKKLIKNLEEPECRMKTYDESILTKYEKKYSMMFLEDGISFDTQKSFNVGFDLETMRITIPEYTLDGSLCGIMGRLNDKKCDHSERWVPIIPCSRSMTLYGYHKNYEKIQDKRLVVIGESEKFVQQLHTMGCNLGLSLCGCDISNVQARYLKGLMTDKIILALDEGLEEEQIRHQAEKLIIDNIIFKNKVGYIFDKDNKILKKGSKNSPSDLGKGKFLELCKSHVVWIN